MINVTPVMDKIQEYKRNWLQHLKTAHRYKILTVLKNHRATDRRNEGRPLKETSVYVRPERVNRWPS